jgi:Protein kinase domain/AAA ATPase domain
VIDLSAPKAVGDMIAGRYRVDEVLGRGGMGMVYRVLDQRSGQACALKRGWATDSRRAHRRAALLEREYHTLAQLAHPRIIAVYEYGLDESGPYYTMELLGGDDLEQAGRLDWKSACALLHDVASSLAILHARGLIHRDISLRNVRRTPEGRAKLIDFGAMMPIGVGKDVVGTPPFIAPEVLQMQELDGRSDLFALGAVGYHLLTDRHAFPAKRIGELRDVWRSRPAPLSRVAPEVPAALHTLIMQLLSLDRDARPASAAEVMERLSAIAGLPAEERIEVSRAYLTTPALVGRDKALVQARREILSLVRRDGGALLIEGVAGAGRSRMLDACVLEGKLLGVSVVRADAGDSAAGDWGVARELCSQLCTLMPVEAASASRLSQDVLAHVIDGLDRGEATVTALSPERSLLLRALRDFVLVLSRSQRLLIAIDDVDKIDEPSAALLAALAHKSARNAVMLAMTVEREQGPSASASLRLLRLVAHSIELQALEAAETQSLIRSIFGDVPNSQLVAARIHALAQGNPRTTLDLVRHLVARDLARYQAGSWLLPAQLDEGDLPQTLADGLLARLSALGPDARALVEVQCIADGESLTVAEYSELLHIAEHKRVFAALDELVAARVFCADGEGHRFVQRGFAPVVLADMPRERERSLHDRVANLFALTSRPVLRRVDHLLRAGRESEGVTLLCSLDLEAQLPPVALLERAIGAAESMKFPPRMLHQLRAAVLSKASVVLAADSFRRYLPVVLERLERDSGLALYRELAELPEHERLKQALTRAQAQFLGTAEDQRVLAPVEAIRELARLAGAVCSFSTQLYELEPLQALPPLAPLATLAPVLAVLRDVVDSSVEWIRGRQLEYREMADRILSRIAQPDRGGLDDAQHRRTRLGLNYAVGLFEATWGLSNTELRATAMEGDREYRVNAWRVRMVMHLAQGNAEQARKCERRAELMQLQEHSEQRYLGMGAGAEVCAHADAGNLLGVKNCVETLTMLAERYPGWRAMHAYGVCRYRWLQGDLQGALKTIVDGMQYAPAGVHNAFVYLAGAHVRLLAKLGRAEEGLRRAREYLEVVRRERLTLADNSLWIGYCEVLVANGECDEAVLTLDGVISEAQRLGRAGLALASLFETRAWVAIRMSDSAAFERYAELCAHEYKRAENPALGAKLVRLLDDAKQQDVGAAAPLAPLRELMQLSAAESEYDTVHSRMLECVDSIDRARCALTLLLQSTESACGYLFGLRGPKPVLLAALPDVPIDPGMTHWLEDCVQSAFGDADSMTRESSSEVTRSESMLHYTDAEGRNLEPVFLLRHQSSEREIIAALVLHLPAGQRTLPSRRMLDDLANELMAHGDVG